MVTRKTGDTWDELFLSITNLEGQDESSRQAIIYSRTNKNGQVTRNYGELKRKGISFQTKVQTLARQLVESAAPHREQKIQELRRLAQQWGYDLVKTVG
jgi:hypothetical protein